MKAKETVMSRVQLGTTIYGNVPAFTGLSECALREYETIAEAQAEVSFKAGQAEGYHEGFEDGVKDGYRAGIRKVMEWVNENMWKQGSIKKWQAFKKEKGL